MRVLHFSDRANNLFCFSLVIESLDLMKKDRSNYAARDAIKFLEKELQEGNKFLRAQKGEESVDPDGKKPHKQDVDVW